MLPDSTIVFLIIAATAVLMASNRLRFDIVALMVVLALMLTGVLTPGEALAGFGSPVVMLVACLLVVGEMLDRTGVAAAIGNWILKNGGSNETRLYIIIMVAAAVLGAIMSSTAVVAIFIPVILRVAARTDIQASRLLMPMSYAALISGMLTLIATTPNIVISQELKSSGHAEFGFFTFTPVGLAVLAVAIAYMLTIGRRLLPRQAEEQNAGVEERSLEDIWNTYRGEQLFQSYILTPGSNLCNKSIADHKIFSRYRVRVIGIMRSRNRGEDRIPLPPPSTMLKSGDTLLLAGKPEDIQSLARDSSLLFVSPSERNQQRWLWELGASTALIHPESSVVGKSLLEARFRNRYNLHVLGVRRDGEVLENFADEPLKTSDSLFVMGTWSAIKQMRNLRHEFVPMETPKEQAEIVPEYKRMPTALLILTAMVVLSILNIIPLVAVVIMTALAAVFSRCMTMEDAYRSIHWGSIVLVAGMLPLADALDKTGGTRMVVDALLGGLGDVGPGVMLSVLFFLTALIGLFLSNTASAVLVAPIAIVAAESLGVSPYPFAVAVLIAASAAFVTPISTPVVTLVVEPGRYQFMDFVRVGVPLLMLCWLTTLFVAPMVFPY